MASDGGKLRRHLTLDETLHIRRFECRACNANLGDEGPDVILCEAACATCEKTKRIQWKHPKARCPAGKWGPWRRLRQRRRNP